MAKRRLFKLYFETSNFWPRHCGHVGNFCNDGSHTWWLWRFHLTFWYLDSGNPADGLCEPPD